MHYCPKKQQINDCTKQGFVVPGYNEKKTNMWLGVGGKVFSSRLFGILVLT